MRVMMMAQGCGTKRLTRTPCVLGLSQNFTPLLRWSPEQTSVVTKLSAFQQKLTVTSRSFRELVATEFGQTEQKKD